MTSRRGLLKDPLSMVLRLSFRQGRAGRRQSTAGKVGRLSGTSLSKSNPGRTGSIIGGDARWTDRFTFAASVHLCRFRGRFLGKLKKRRLHRGRLERYDARFSSLGAHRRRRVTARRRPHLFPPRDAAARRKESLRAAQDRTKPGEGGNKTPALRTTCDSS